ncbi:MAG: ammonium transporter [Chelatococcus sp.]|jgi:Amt family ammonium transporter|uniref:ammonium transporter n=1 Tax=unclassified Chelatococcus TaxID=2638111 RepID=UPI001BCB14E0|nr:MULTISPECIES: ammonium transporter [unclassified Chelatococcus]CAH1657404.1 ammonia/ammonium transporter [Hyphomicrobiales bacterium]MBS7740676.1 ammonium transporter [Chelatococcus sp. HY11]MBX3539168.1 ammonium transporter [Chelatococcus sp.]MBX3546090.1 ammonium transporter [Chelatococcus sp.]MCO5079839.1 ammonium transporter [Chelatococcus sp.]
MTLKREHKAGLAALALALAAGTIAGVGPAFAQAAAEAAPAAAPVPNKGDTAWMLVSAILVLAMTIPGLALFYGGLVRTKNMLSVLTQVFSIVCVVVLVWVIYGYSLAFTGTSAFIGNFSKAFLAGITGDSTTDTFTKGVVIPEFVFICFQMTFACITPALIVGSFAERIKFSALLLFTVLWVTFVYFPMAHMVWFSEGLLFKMGALDFAGGTVVHINAGMAGLVGALMIGKRTGYGKEPMPPHSMTMTMIGASLLWVGWFGFNAGSNLEANGGAALAMLNTFVATAAAGMAWQFTEWGTKGHPSLLGTVSGAVAGLVAVTPAAGLIGPMGSIILGLIAGVICFYASTTVKNALGYDDSLDVFGIHCIGGIVGSLLTGILVAPALGGVGVADYSMGGQLWTQFVAVVVALLWSGIGSAILYKVVDLIVGLRISVEGEREGLDLADHGERAYNY